MDARKSQITPVFGSDGSVCDLDALFLSRTNRFHKGCLLFPEASLQPCTVEFNEQSLPQHGPGQCDDTT